jgi:predicted metal-dependent phosphoesterase TrpH
MINYMRNKIIGVERKDDHNLVARGTLSDDIYEMRLKVTVGLDDLVITTIEGDLIRITTPECKAADNFLQEAVGLRVDSNDFPRQVHRTIWRRSCQHYASLLVDMGDCLRQAAGVLTRRAEEEPADAQEQQPATGQTDAATEDKQTLVKIQGPGFVVDLHTHTSPTSPCSSVSAADLLERAKWLGLDGVCLTDHNYVWDQAEIDRLSREYGLAVFRGNEITTDQGDMVVFGLDKDIQGVIPLTELRREVDRAGGFIIAAHPFRGFLTFGVGKLGLTVDQAKKRELFKLVDGIEIRNGKVTDEENDFAEQVGRALGLPLVGGSDAHKVEEVGCHAVRFEQPIADEQELITALKQGRFEVISIKNNRKEG